MADSKQAEVNVARRRFLTAATAVVGGVGGVAAAVPFISMWLPSERAKALGAPIEIDISKLGEGQMVTALWRGKAVYVVKRSQAQLGILPGEDARLKDAKSELAVQPDYIKRDAIRASKPEIFVVLGVCTHLGCGPKLYADPGAQAFDANWKGGFFCPCHNSRFDMAGRVYAGSPAAANLEIPPYSFSPTGSVLVGVNPEAA
jgi:ubiquinol-cytochrome c reductase iron-sulfur subunit